MVRYAALLCLLLCAQVPWSGAQVLSENTDADEPVLEQPAEATLPQLATRPHWFSHLMKPFFAKEKRAEIPLPGAGSHYHLMHGKYGVPPHFSPYTPKHPATNHYHPPLKFETYAQEHQHSADLRFKKYSQEGHAQERKKSSGLVRFKTYAQEHGHLPAKTFAQEHKKKQRKVAADALRKASKALKRASTALGRYGNTMNVYMNLHNLKQWRDHALVNHGLPLPVGGRKYVVVPLPSTPAPHHDVCARGVTALCSCVGNTLLGWQDGEGIQTCLGQRWGKCVCAHTVCAPGSTQQCTCSGKDIGVQRCGKRARAWGRCRCAKHHHSGSRLLSVHKPTTQSGETDGAAASRAVDGHTTGIFKMNSCTKTASSIGAWWKVDLQKAYVLHRVVIWNRQDCCEDRLDHVEVKACCTPPTHTWKKCGSIHRAARKNTVECQGVQGRFVQITSKQPNQVRLTLCEVQVFGQSLGKL